MSSHIDQIENDYRRFAAERRALHAVAAEATEVRLAMGVLEISKHPRLFAAWTRLCIALDAAGYGADGPDVKPPSFSEQELRWIRSVARRIRDRGFDDMEADSVIEKVGRALGEAPTSQRTES